MEITIQPKERFSGEVRLPGDKSISHRALIFSALTKDTVEIEGLLKAEDPLSTLKCLQALGVEARDDGERMEIRGKGLHGFSEPDHILDTGNSGTTARLLTGLLAGQPFSSILTGDDSLRKRPMGRVSEPLRQMGAFIDGRKGGTLLPLFIRGKELRPMDYTLPVASAQVKSALLLAALYTRGVTTIREPLATRDHTERMLRYLGGRVQQKKGGVVIMENPCSLQGSKIKVPKDISSAAFFLVAAALAPRGDVFLPEVGINPARTGLLDVLRRMGAHLEVLNKREYNLEPVADLKVRGGNALKAVEITGEMIPRLVDEIPVLAVAALFARGDTVIKGAAELRVKESDRLKAISEELKKMGACIQELPDGLIIQGGHQLKGGHCMSYGDHRIAMSLAVAALFAHQETTIQGVDSVQISFPGFFDLFQQLSS